MKKRIVVFTGAGVSADSGIATFRDSDGLWANYRIEDVCTPEALAHNRDLVLEFYNIRRRELLEKRPNPAHYAIAKLEEKYEVIVVTQNIDDLHERAGSTDVLHLHGELSKLRSSDNEANIYPIEGWREAASAMMGEGVNGDEGAGADGVFRDEGAGADGVLRGEGAGADGVLRGEGAGADGVLRGEGAGAGIAAAAGKTNGDEENGSAAAAGDNETRRAAILARYEHVWKEEVGARGADGALLRPHVVFFGESVPNYDLACRIASTAEIFIVCGTSLAVYPAAALMFSVPSGVPVYLVDPKRPDLRNVRNPLTFIQKRAAEGMPEVCEKLLHEA